MTLVKVAARTPEEGEQAEEIKQLREAWAAARFQMNAPRGNQLCAVSGCRTMPFVDVKTHAGRVAVCLSHYGRAQSLLGRGATTVR
jgi:hypothetical protein